MLLFLLRDVQKFLIDGLLRLAAGGVELHENDDIFPKGLRNGCRLLRGDYGAQ